MTIYEKNTKKVIAIISEDTIILNKDYNIGYNDEYVGDKNELYYREFILVKGGNYEFKKHR